MYINPYIRDCVRVFPEQNRYGKKRYDMNENPEGLPKEFVDKVVKEITPEFLSIYPEPDKFLNKYAGFIGVKKENVVPTNGSDVAIRLALEVFAEEGADVVTVAPSFEMYWVNCTMLGLHHVPVAIHDDLTISVDDILAAITPKTDVVVILNPNNPVGGAYSMEDACRIAKKAAENDAILLVDEAYHYFNKETLLPLIDEFDNVIVFRTFSKLFSMAALRLGCAIGKPEVVNYIKKASPSFEVNAVALLFAERILDEPQIIEDLIAKQAEGKAWAVETLKEEGYEAFPENGNFLFVKPKREIPELKKDLEERGVLVKSFGNPLLSRYLRISTGSKQAMEVYVKEFLEADRR